MASHIVQSPVWGSFKTAYGTRSFRAGGVQYTVHKIPLTPLFYAYCPKVDPSAIEWSALEKSLTENSCIAINFDVPNVVKGSDEAKRAEKILSERCAASPRSTFAGSNIMLDISLSEEDLLKNMHKKHRYNLGLAQRKGVTVKRGEGRDDFKVFYELLSKTAERQKYFIHPESYYQQIWEMLHPLGHCHIVTAYFQDSPLASWMLFTYEGVLYYPYGGSSDADRQVFASNLVGWESILLGKERGCTMFDMWGAASDPDNKNDPWYGFTNFKLKFGGHYVEYIDSYDLILNRSVYDAFNMAQEVRWKLLKLLK